MVAYHDQEWGRPLHDERRLFEMLCLEGAQAGLSWSTILYRREGYREAYEDFDAERIAAYNDERQAQLLLDGRIIRNRAKVRAFRDNAAAVLRLREEAGGLDAYLWGFVGGAPIVNHFESMAQIPARTPLAEELSPRPRGAWLPLRRPGHRLRLHAVDRPGQRPPRRAVSPTPRARRKRPSGSPWRR